MVEHGYGVSETPSKGGALYCAACGDKFPTVRIESRCYCSECARNLLGEKPRQEVEDKETEWFISVNYFGGQEHFIAARIVDPSEPLHSGNIEYCGHYTQDREQVARLVDELNGTKNKED